MTHVYANGYSVIGGTGDTFAANVACDGLYNAAAPPSAGNPCLGDGTGGAIYDSGAANLTLSNSSFTGNQAGSPSKDEGEGGAVYIYSSYAVHFANDTFTHNVAGSEAGAVENVNGAVSIVGGSMSYNLAGDTGGAVYQDNAGFFSAGVNYTNNQAGGLFVCTGPDVNNHVFCTNSSGPTAANACPNTYHQCDFSGGTGGAFYINEPTSITGGNINNNNAVTLLHPGGAVDTSHEGVGGAAYINDNVVFTGVNIEFNHAYNGGGIYLTSYPETMHGGMMVGNKAMNDGGAYYLSGTSHLIVDGATIVANTAVTQTGGIWDGAIGEVALAGAASVTGNMSPGTCKNVLNPCVG
jgi:hypothetical protein